MISCDLHLLHLWNIYQHLPSNHPNLSIRDILYWIILKTETTSNRHTKTSQGGTKNWKSEQEDECPVNVSPANKKLWKESGIESAKEWIQSC